MFPLRDTFVTAFPSVLFRLKKVEKFFNGGIDILFHICYTSTNSILQTVEAEITAMMPLQRVRDAESRVRNKLSNGPRRAQSNGDFPEYSATLQADVICRGYAGILLSARVMP